ncbi:SRPBCC family protein [Pontibacter sp. 13R65]|uniref:SRPBCC family protein n=1 Tax=Pontibacter sp. 13R65 TaxID=3127458 RepID=UPI00301D2598
MEMQQIRLSTEINATKEKVWDVLLSDATYRAWTSVFEEGSYAETDWKEGSKALFLTPEGSGMVSRIKLHKPNDVITIEHLGMVKDGEEIYDSEEMKSWQGSTETYRVRSLNGKTELTIEQDSAEKHYEWLSKTWEQALQKVKELAETDNKHGRSL